MRTFIFSCSLFDCVLCSMYLMPKYYTAFPQDLSISELVLCCAVCDHSGCSGLFDSLRHALETVAASLLGAQ